ncbi:hypothetical protein Tco_0016321 [Tanacetum coccineum]
MDQDSTHMVAASKVLMLKLENGETLPKTTTVEGVVTVMPITTAKEKAQRRLEVKARDLMIGIPNEHQLKFNSIKDVKKLLEARNKADLDTMSMNDLYNNLKVYELEVKGISSSSSSTQNMDFVSSSNNNTSNTNEAVNTAYGVYTASTKGLKSVEEKLEVYKANESIYLLDIKGLKFEIHLGEITIRELRKKIEIVQKEKDGIQSMSSKEEPKVVRKNDDAPIIEEWVLDDEGRMWSRLKLKRKLN